MFWSFDFVYTVCFLHGGVSFWVYMRDICHLLDCILFSNDLHIYREFEWKWHWQIYSNFMSFFNWFHNFVKSKLLTFMVQSLWLLIVDWVRSVYLRFVKNVDKLLEPVISNLSKLPTHIQTLPNMLQNTANKTYEKTRQFDNYKDIRINYHLNLVKIIVLKNKNSPIV